MSPRVPPPNYTQAPNMLFDELLRTIKSLSELKVLLVVIRHTIGWHEEESKLSLSEIQERAGLSRQGAIDGVKANLESGLIERRLEGVLGAQAAFYALNLAGQQDGPALVNDLDQVRSTVQTSASQRSGPGPIEEKETGKKAPLSPPRGADEDWEKVLEQLADVVPGMTLTAFRESLSIASRDGGTIVLQASDDTVAGWTRDRFLPDIEAAAARAFGADTVVELPKSETERARETLASRRPPRRSRKGFLR